jgi:hypothetical protein
LKPDAVKGRDVDDGVVNLVCFNWVRLVAIQRRNPKFHSSAIILLDSFSTDDCNIYPFSSSLQPKNLREVLSDHGRPCATVYKDVSFADFTILGPETNSHYGHDTIPVER